MHELVNKMYRELKKEHTREEVDALVRQWLEEKYKQIGNPVEGYSLREILGLSENPQKETPVNTKAEKVEWCDHLEGDGHGGWRNLVHNCVITDGWIFCPWCSKPRPEPKSLEGKFLEYLTLSSNNTEKTKIVVAREMAEIAEQHFKENK